MEKKRFTLLKNPPGWVRKLKAGFLETVYPEGAICQGCGKISDGQCLCPDCRQELRRSGMLDAWERKELEGVTAWSLRGHTGLARRLVIRLKYQADACLAEALAEILFPLPMGLSFPPDTVVTWVPMPEGRKRERCVDHSRLLAEAAARKLRLLCRPLLQRREDRAHRQEGLSGERRRANLLHAYTPLREISFPVLLIDDVMTTGTTVKRCIAALREAGAKEITVLTFTHSIR